MFNFFHIFLKFLPFLTSFLFFSSFTLQPNPIIQILAWLIFSGITIITIYDQKDSFKQKRQEIEKSLQKSFTNTVTETSSLFWETSSKYPLLLTDAIQAPLNGMSTYKRITYCQNSSVDPELVFILDPKNKKSLFGYNPWTIRLSEFVFFNKRQIKSCDLNDAFVKYGCIEKRFGK